MSMGNVRKFNEYPLTPTLSHRERELLAPVFFGSKEVISANSIAPLTKVHYRVFRHSRSVSHRERELLAPAFLEVKRSSQQTRAAP